MLFLCETTLSLREMKYIPHEQPDGLCQMPVVAQEKAHAVGEEVDSVTPHG